MLTTNPGSPEAQRLGCTCPVLDNAYGKGAVIDGRISETSFFTDPECPIHVDRRLIDAEPGGEDDSGRAAIQVPSEGRDDSSSDPVSPESPEPVREGSGDPELPEALGRDTRSQEDRGETLP